MTKIKFKCQFLTLAVILPTLKKPDPFRTVWQILQAKSHELQYLNYDLKLTRYFESQIKF